MPTSCTNKAPDVTYTYDGLIRNWYLCPKPGYICNEDKTFKICADGFFLLPSTLECLKTCPDGYWGNIPTKQCVKCTLPCGKCINDKTCKTCIKDFFLHYPLPEFNCLGTCPISFWPDRNTDACKDCPKACLTCDSDKVCNSCNKGFFFYKENRECVSKCPDGFYLPELSEFCMKCSASCKTCELKPDACRSCNRGKFFEETIKTCSDKCREGFFGDISDNACKACDKTCLTCKGRLENDCLTCDPKGGVKLVKGYCTNKCPGSLIKKKNSDDCIDLNACFDSLLFNVPKMFNIQILSYKAGLVYKLKDNCGEYAADLATVWQPVPDAVFSVDRFSFEIPIDKLKDGVLNLSVELLYNNSPLKAFTGSSFLITNKVNIILFFVFFCLNNFILDCF